ncbi:unnamed protein product [Urochloa humidicola]
MSFRRFVYLVMNDTRRRDFPLRRIDASRLFFPKGERPPPVPPPLEDARLPPAAIRFSPPITDTSNGDMEFMLLGGGGGDGRKHCKVVAADHTGRCVLYDPAAHTVRTLPELSAPKFMSAALTIGGKDLYILDKHFHLNVSRDDCFDALIFNEDEGDWDSYTFPPPPYADTYDPDSQRSRAHIISYAVVGNGRGGSSIWVSKKGLGTHSFNVRTAKWTKAGDWAMPFWGSGRYIPEHKLWIGLSADEDDGVVCAADLTKKKQPAVPRILWRDDPPPDWKGKSSFLVHLGHSRFCLARFFWIIQPGGLSCIKFVVFTGLEVERSDGEEQLRVVKHRSHRYSLVNKLINWVL